jgi:hypothetical protein
LRHTFHTLKNVFVSEKSEVRFPLYQKCIKDGREGYFAFIPIMANSRGALDFLTNPDHGKDEDFFLTENSKSIGALSLRKQFNKARDCFVVFLQKLSGDDCYPTSYINFIDDESPQVSFIIKKILRAISITNYE